MKKQNINNMVTEIRNAAKNADLVAVTNLRPYDLRHLFCSFALMNGIDRNVVREWMGHKSFQMIDRVYSHSLGEYRRQQMAKMQIGLPSNGNGNGESKPVEPTS